MVLEGAFDDVDMAMMLHAHPNMPQAGVNLDGSSLGFVAKTIEFYGRASHGSLPFEGINALNAATMGLMGIHANREIFRDEDHHHSRLSAASAEPGYGKTYGEKCPCSLGKRHGLSWGTHHRVY